MCVFFYRLWFKANKLLNAFLVKYIDQPMSQTDESSNESSARCFDKIIYVYINLNIDVMIFPFTNNYIATSV